MKTDTGLRPTVTCGPAMLEAAKNIQKRWYATPHRDTAQRGGHRQHDCPTDSGDTEETLNSLLHCCTDIPRSAILVFRQGESRDRSILLQRYPFLEFVECAEGELRAHIHGRYWLHVDPGWYSLPRN